MVKEKSISELKSRLENEDDFILLDVRTENEVLVSKITEVSGPAELGLENENFTRVSIFMNVFNCHVNRIPTAGEVE